MHSRFVKSNIQTFIILEVDSNDEACAYRTGERLTACGAKQVRHRRRKCWETDEKTESLRMWFLCQEQARAGHWRHDTEAMDCGAAVCEKGYMRFREMEEDRVDEVVAFRQQEWEAEWQMRATRSSHNPSARECKGLWGLKVSINDLLNFNHSICRPPKMRQEHSTELQYRSKRHCGNEIL